MATVTLDISQTVDAEDGKVHVDITQTLTGGLQGTSEHRVLDWQTRLHSDHIFGNLEGKSHLIGGLLDANGKVRPTIDIQTTVADEQIAQFLNGEINSDGTPSDGWLVDAVDTEKPGLDGVDPAHGLWLQSWVKSLDVGYEWSAEQVSMDNCQFPFGFFLFFFPSLLYYIFHEKFHLCRQKKDHTKQVERILYPPLSPPPAELLPVNQKKTKKKKKIDLGL